MSRSKNQSTTLYWHDYETFGADPKRDRPSQFAGVRTDCDLNEIGEPLMLYCKPADDLLPHPDACLITGITPQEAAAKGVIERDFIARVHHELSKPGTCGVGYNSIRFDDEVTRYTLYRNFYDAYAREWQNGNSRWDLIDVVRMTAALRPDGVNWPKHEDGTPSFRLQHLTKANGIEHSDAHDALADVRATIAIARILRDAQPKLFQWAFDLRDKRKVAEQFDLANMTPLVHVSSKYPAAQNCIALVVPLAMHPRFNNRVIVYDLSADPASLLTADAEEIQRLVFTAQRDLAEGEARIPLKDIYFNRSPMVAPAATLRAVDAERLGIDLAQCEQHRQQLLAAHPGAKIANAFQGESFPPAADAELALYDGFIPNGDKPRMQQIQNSTGEELAAVAPHFDDPRLNALLPRYRARNFPESLSANERADWDDYRRWRLTDETSGFFTVGAFDLRLDELRGEHKDSPERLSILNSLAEWRQHLVDSIK